MNETSIPVGTRVRLREPERYPVIGAAVGIVRGRLKASGRLRVEFETVRHVGRSMMSSFRDSEVERVE